MDPGGPDVYRGASSTLPPPPVEALQVIMTKFKEHAQARLDEFVQDVLASGLIVTTVIREGDPSDVIVEVADAGPDTRVAMGSHGRSGVACWVYGSVADCVIHHVHVGRAPQGR